MGIPYDPPQSVLSGEALAAWNAFAEVALCHPSAPFDAIAGVCSAMPSDEDDVRDIKAFCEECAEMFSEPDQYNIVKAAYEEVKCTMERREPLLYIDVESLAAELDSLDSTFSSVYAKKICEAYLSGVAVACARGWAATESFRVSCEAFLACKAVVSSTIGAQSYAVPLWIPMVPFRVDVTASKHEGLETQYVLFRL